MSSATAWMLAFGGPRRVAVGERELLHLLPEPHFLPVPLAPPYCASVMVWQGQLLPVWDLRVWSGAAALDGGQVLAAIVGYQQRPRQTPQFGVIRLTESPQRVQVRDEQASALPDDAPWHRVAAACFLQRDEAVPILDLVRMFMPQR